jgi:enamine deaminase RidA (YjgF/YER057c/UK114 family)
MIRRTILSLSKASDRLASLNITLPPPGLPKGERKVSDSKLTYRSNIVTNTIILSLPFPLPFNTIIKANYNMSCMTTSNTLYISGHLPILPSGSLITGRLGSTVTLTEGQSASRLACLHLLSTIRSSIGTLDNVVKVNKIFGIVSSDDDFYEQHLVLNGASDLIMEVFGKEKGYHARSGEVLRASVPLV